MGSIYGHTAAAKAAFTALPALVFDAKILIMPIVASTAERGEKIRQFTEMER